MKNIFILVLLSLGTSLFAYPSHPPQITEPLRRLYQLEETRKLLTQVESQGHITLKASHFGVNSSNAAWVCSERTIYLNFANERTLGNLICSIVFELHNALSDSQFDYYDQLAQERKISREEYIIAIESIEYVNACCTAQILEKGIRHGIFPCDSHWPIAPCFQQHFHIQKMAGHAALIGDMYDDLIGTGLHNGGFKTETR